MDSGRGLLLISCMALASMTFTACASNTNPPSGAQNEAPAAKRQTETVQSVSGEKCVIDLLRACNEGNPAVMGGPFGGANAEDYMDRLGHGSDTGAGNRSTVGGAISLTQGDHPINVFCGYSKVHKAVYGRLATSGTPSDAEIAQLRASGFCTN